MQITVGETVGVEGRVRIITTTSGALRDMVQNHLMQLLCLTGDGAARWISSADSVRDEKLKVLRVAEADRAA